MMPTVLVLVALIVALVHEAQAAGKELLGWAVVLLCLAGIWGSIGQLT